MNDPLGSRLSEITAASLSAIPSRRAACAKSRTPPSDIRRPPSKAAVSLLPRTDENTNGSAVGSDIAGVGGLDEVAGLGGSTQSLRHISALRYARQFRNSALMNKKG